MTSPQPVIPARRRAPFADSPSVGTRGTRTQHKILTAALQVFGDVGYHGCRVERITNAAGCSRPSFYQYFSSKEDLFRQLAGEVARSLFAIAERMENVTPDRAGRGALLAWLDDYAATFDRYAPVFSAFSAAVGSDDAVATGARKVAARQTAALAARLDGSLQRRGAGGAGEVVSILLHTVTRANRYRNLLTEVDGGASLDLARVNDALADVFHRALFGPLPGVNFPLLLDLDSSSGPNPAKAMAGIEFPPAPRPSLGPAGRETRARLLRAGRRVFAERGYHDTRVDDVVAAAAASHGTFYRYFRNKHDLFRIIAARAGRSIVAAMDRIPALAGAPLTRDGLRAMRDWFDDYSATYEKQGPIVRVWVEAMALDPELGRFSTEAIEGVRRRLASFLAPRGFGDVDAEALVLLSLIDRDPFAMPSRTSEDERRQQVVGVIARGFLTG